MLGILMSRSLRKYAIGFNFRTTKPPTNCYAKYWWRELIIDGMYDTCDCKVWCKFPITRHMRRL